MWTKLSTWFKKKVRTVKDEPYITIKGLEMATDGRLKVEMDWNPQFIRYLRKAGIQGRTEEEVISVWLNKVSAKVLLDIQEIGFEPGKQSEEYV